MWMLLKALLLILPLSAADPVTENDFTLKDFAFASGERMAELRIHYRTLGTLHRDAKGQVDNAVLILHGTGGSSAGFLGANFAGELFGAGQLLDTTKYFIVMPDGIGHGKSSKPSDGLRAAFPTYGYRDMVEAQHRLIAEGLKIDRLRLVMGTSMGGMHSWMWGERYPDMMDALMPLASVPGPISGRNRIWRRMIIDAIRTDPSWEDGNYTATPRNMRLVHEITLFMAGNSTQRAMEMPTTAKADAVIEDMVGRMMAGSDANNMLCALSASADYDPSADLEKIKAPLTAINTADDLINPPELGVLEREIKRVRHGRAVVLPLGPDTKGHGSHTYATLWKSELADLLARSARK